MSRPSSVGLPGSRHGLDQSDGFGMAHACGRDTPWCGLDNGCVASLAAETVSTVGIIDWCRQRGLSTTCRGQFPANAL